MKSLHRAPESVLHDESAPCRVLVVESDRLVRTLIVEWLQLSGHEAVCVTDPAAGTNAAPAGNFPVDLILIDLPAPLSAAHRIIEQIRPSRPVTPIVAMSADVTASGRAAHEALARELGVAALLVKPFSRHALLAAINRSRT